MLNNEKLPKHIAIIMDGNGRWASQRGLPRILGHRAGADTVLKITEACCDLGIQMLTLYAFSWENWQRPSEEVGFLMNLLGEFLSREEVNLKKNQIRLRAVGRLSELPASARGVIEGIMQRTSEFKRMSLVLALSYGGRQEIVDAARSISESVKAGKLLPEEITEEVFSKHLYMPEMADPDLLIRTSGEQRISNFLLWQVSYCEFYITKKLWPDFTKQDLIEAIEVYQGRERRFGRTEAVK